MKTHHLTDSLLIGMFVLMAFCHPRNPELATSSDSAVTEESIYDSLTAARYGADDYGMRKYVMAFLKRGPVRSADSVEAMRLQMAHLENIMKMAEEGKLVLAGPFYGDGEIRGIYIFNVGSMEEAEALTRTDPAIQAGSLVMELNEWYGPAGLMAVHEINETLARKSIMGDN